MRRTGIAIAGALLLSACGASSGAAAAHQLTVSAASSLTDAFTEVGANFEDANPGVTVAFNFGASDQLANQIEEGADGTLHLRFTFLLEAIEGIAPGSAEEQAYGERMKEDYLGAVQATLETARRLKVNGQFAAAAP